MNILCICSYFKGIPFLIQQSILGNRVFLITCENRKKEDIISYVNELWIKEISPDIDDEKLEAVAKALDVSVEAVKNFSDEGVINYFNTFNEAVANNNFGRQDTINFNPIDKVVELYERLVQAEKDKVEYLEKIAKGK